MLDNIKSSFFIKIIFSHIKEKRKLKIIRYNKRLQKNIDIYLINYKVLSERYIIYENNGIVKEFEGYNNELKFEGKYLNGERNGMGKEYVCNVLRFEGEYLNGLRNGKGKEYLGTTLRFEGEYLNGKKNGKGKEYGFDGELIFEGEYKNDKRNGKGIIYGIDKLKTEKLYLNGTQRASNS